MCDRRTRFQQDCRAVSRYVTVVKYHLNSQCMNSILCHINSQLGFVDNWSFIITLAASSNVTFQKDLFISTQGDGLRQNADKGTAFQHADVYNHVQCSIISRLQKLTRLYQRAVFFSVIMMLAGCKCSLSMVTVDCPIAYTAQCSVHSNMSHRQTSL